MAFLQRLCRHRLITHRRRRLGVSLSSPSLNQDSTSASYDGAKEGSFPISYCGGARFFSAASEAPLINEKIKVPEVRLVTDRGHLVVSIREALNQARQLNLDLVMVQKSANPPVCKIMDFHREKYNLEVKNKDRAKSQQGVTLRKGACKEVRFSAVIEAKDLKMKADTVKRLMDRGYRVRCVATGKAEKELGGLLSRLIEMIQDVSVIESGPREEKQSAYIIVRHIKFGPPKKSGVQKKAKDSPRAESDDDISDSGLEAEVESPSEDEQEEEPVSPRFETRNEKREVSKNQAWSLHRDAGSLDNIFDARFGSESNRDASVSPRPMRASSNVPTMGTKPGPEPPISPENRYKRNPGGSNNRYPPPRPPIQGSRDFSRPDPRGPPRERWPSPSDRHASDRENPREGGNRRPASDTDPSRPAAASSYGIFSSSNK